MHLLNNKKVYSKYDSQIQYFTLLNEQIILLIPNLY